jgi:hypothetical protein
MMESYGVLRVMKEEILIFNEEVKGTKKNFKLKKLKFFWPCWRDKKFFFVSRAKFRALLKELVNSGDF